MNNADQSLPLFEFVSGWLFFLTFLCFCFSVATLRYHIDATKFASPDEINRAITNFFPKREILTKSGRLRYNVAIVSLIVSMGTAALIIAKNLAQ